MMSFANPAFLWSLLGLSVPIAIHFLSRKEGLIIKLGSLRHVHETSTQQFKGIRLNEILLLILRSLIILCVSLMLSGLQFSSEGDKKWIVAEAGVEKNPAIKKMMDSLITQGYERHALSSFSGRNGHSNASLRLSMRNINYYSTIELLQKENLSEAVVFAFNRLEQFQGKRIPVPANIKWIGVDPEPKEYVLKAVQQKDSVWLRIGNTNATVTAFTNQKTKSVNDSIPVESAKQIAILIVHDQYQQQERSILKASLKAIDEITPDNFLLVEKLETDFAASDSAAWCFWISQKKHRSDNSKTILLEPENTSQLIEQREPMLWRITKSIDEETALREGLTVALASLLTQDVAHLEVARANDQRMALEKELWSASDDERASAIANTDSSTAPYILMILMLLIIIERFVAYHHNQ